MQPRVLNRLYNMIGLLRKHYTQKRDIFPWKLVLILQVTPNIFKYACEGTCIVERGLDEQEKNE